MSVRSRFRRARLGLALLATLPVTFSASASDGFRALEACESQLKQQCQPYQGLAAVIRCAWAKPENFTAPCRALFSSIFRIYPYEMGQATCRQSPTLTPTERRLCQELSEDRKAQERAHEAEFQNHFGAGLTSLYHHLEREAGGP